MGVQPPFLYDAVKTDSSRTPYSSFDPKAVTRASQTPRAPRPKQEGPLISFNQHPDSYLILPYGDKGAKPMNPSVKSWVKWMRIIQLILRCLEILSAIGLLVMMILIRGVDTVTEWVIRIAPGVAILHTTYGIYHLGRRASGRTPGTSASYMLFASLFDVSITPFFAFIALVARTKQSTWITILPNQHLMPILSEVVFYVAAVGAGLHVVSLAISLYLAVIFRKITNLPPDMNPLEDNLTSRHKRNKSSMSTSTSSEKRILSPLESKRSSGAIYQDLSRPPTIPFLHTRSNSTESFSTYKSTPPPSRDSRLDLPSRQYQLTPGSARSSVVDLKRASFYGASNPPERASYSSLPASQNSSQQSPRPVGKQSESWFAADSLNDLRSRSSSPRKGNYQPLQQQPEHEGDLSYAAHPNPLEANPPTPRHNYHPSRESPLAEISLNRLSDVADRSYQTKETSSNREVLKAKNYGDLKPGTPPIFIGGNNNRQLSSGNDFSNGSSAMKAFGRRGVSGKIVEEGRVGSGNGWGTRFRKVSGL